MNTEKQIIYLRDELLALKSAFARKGADIIVYSYSLDVTVNNSGDIFTLTLNTNDGYNTIASVEIDGYSRRIPYQGGARWYLNFNLEIGEQTPTVKTVTVRSMRKGVLSVS